MQGPDLGNANLAASAPDAVDVLLHRLVSATEWALLPQFGGAEHADDHNNWSRYREVESFRFTALMLMDTWWCAGS